MAGDWIKMRGNLWDDPRVSKMCDLTESCEASIVGGLYWLWATADQHTEDGFMPGLTLRSIDRKTGINGFASSLKSIGWIIERDDGIEIINFSEHNGQSAKRRCTDAQRKASIRNVSADEADKEQTNDGQNRQMLGAREEKRREEKSKDIKPIVAKAPKAKRFDLESLPVEWANFCTIERPDLMPKDVWNQFKDYWIGVPGQKGTKTDWDATWRNWVRRQNQPAKKFETVADRNSKVLSGLTRGLMGNGNANLLTN